MAGVESAPSAPPRRRGIPKWVWFVVAAVLAMMVLVAGVVAWAIATIGRIADPEVQWRAIREAIAVDDPLPDYVVLGLPEIDGMRAWSISDEAQGRHALLFRVSRERAGGAPIQDLEKLLDATVPVETGTIVIQGREMPCARGRHVAEGLGGEFRSGPAIVVDLSRDDSQERLVWMMTVQWQSGRVEDASAIEFLKPFHVGPER